MNDIKSQGGAHLPIRLYRVRHHMRDKLALLLFGGASLIVFLIYCTSSSSTNLEQPKKVAFHGLFGNKFAFGGSQRRKRLFLKVGGVPQEGFGSSLQFIKDGVRMARVLNIDFAAVRTFDLGQIGFDYNVIDELNRGVDFKNYNWNNMCNLHTSVTRFGGHEDFPVRVLRLRKEVDRFSHEASKAAMGEGFDQAYVDDVRARLSHCDVIIFADQEVHQVSEWDRFTRDYFRNAIADNAKFKYRSRIASPVKARDIHIHYRWGDVVQKILENHDDGKWNFNNDDLERTIKSVEKCLGKQLTSNIFMKRSEKMESDHKLREIVSPLRPDAMFLEGEDDIVDLYHLSQAKILAITGGTYSSTAAAIGDQALVIHNGWHPNDYNHLRRWGIPILKQGDEVDNDTCTMVRNLF